VLLLVKPSREPYSTQIYIHGTKTTQLQVIELGKLLTCVREKVRFADEIGQALLSSDSNACQEVKKED
jgi:hypothetical protein